MDIRKIINDYRIKLAIWHIALTEALPISHPRLDRGSTVTGFPRTLSGEWQHRNFKKNNWNRGLCYQNGTIKSRKFSSGVWPNWLRRHVRDVEIPSSNLGTPIFRNFAKFGTIGCAHPRSQVRALWKGFQPKSAKVLKDSKKPFYPKAGGS